MKTIIADNVSSNLIDKIVTRCTRQISLSLYIYVKCAIIYYKTTLYVFCTCSTCYNSVMYSKRDSLAAERLVYKLPTLK